MLKPFPKSSPTIRYKFQVPFVSRLSSFRSIFNVIFFILLHNRAVGSASISTMVLIGRFVLHVFEYVFVVHLQRPLWVPVSGFLCPLLSHTRPTTHLSPIHSLLLVIYHSLIRYSFVDCCLMVVILLSVYFVFVFVYLALKLILRLLIHHLPR